MNVSRRRLGSWTLPSGNNVVVTLDVYGTNFGALRLLWDEPPPFDDPADDEDYRDRVFPAIVREIAVLTETPVDKICGVMLR